MPSVLETMVKSIGMSKGDELALLKALRDCRMDDDNDPLLQMTLSTGIMARYMETIPKGIDRSAANLRSLANGCIEDIGTALGESRRKLDELTSEIRIAMDGRIKILQETHESLIELHEEILKAQKELVARQKAVEDRIWLISEHAEDLNRSVGDEIEFRRWVKARSWLAVLLMLAALAFSAISFSRTRKAETTTRNIAPSAVCVQAAS